MARIAESSYELAGLNRTPTDGLVLPYYHAPLEVGQVGSLLATPHVIMAFKLKVSHFCARGHDVQSNKSRTFLRLGAWRPGGRAGVHNTSKTALPTGTGRTSEN